MKDWKLLFIVYLHAPPHFAGYGYINENYILFLALLKNTGHFFFFFFLACEKKNVISVQKVWSILVSIL